MLIKIDFYGINKSKLCMILDKIYDKTPKILEKEKGNLNDKQNISGGWCDIQDHFKYKYDIFWSTRGKVNFLIILLAFINYY